MQKQIRVQHQQRGFVLIIALILMVVMAIGAITSFRLSGASDVINNNTRATVQAQQAAGAALNYCRDVLLMGGSLKTTKNNTGDSQYDGLMWASQVSWNLNKNVITATDLPLPGNTINPECLVEDMTEVFEAKRESIEQKVVAFKITARGYSPNFVSKNNVTRSGAESWVQVTLVRTLG